DKGLAAYAERNPRGSAAFTEKGDKFVMSWNDVVGGLPNSLRTWDLSGKQVKEEPRLDFSALGLPGKHGESQLVDNGETLAVITGKFQWELDNEAVQKGLKKTDSDAVPKKGEEPRLVFVNVASKKIVKSCDLRLDTNAMLVRLSQDKRWF